MTFGRVIFGDNQFLGVNHADQGKASLLHQKFSNSEEIIKVIGYAYEAGIRDFMFTAHSRYSEVFSEIVRSNLFPEMYYSPCIPYAYKYWSRVSEYGVVGSVVKSIGEAGPLSVAAAGFGLLFGQSANFVYCLTKLEMLAMRGLRIRGIFLQNLAFDFIVAMELYKLVEVFFEVVSDRFKCIPGFITMNHPRSVDVLCNKIGLVLPWVCANYNVSGFRMNPSFSLCSESFAAARTNNIAMSVFASGKASASESLDFISSKMANGGINSVLFGSSNSDNIRKNSLRLL